jgi:hypothetical protein
MSFFIKDDSFLTEENKNFIDNIVLGDNFPYYICNHSIEGDNKYFLYHVILRRKEDRKENEMFNSSFYPEFLSIIDSFFKKHKIKVKEVLRMTVNYSFNNTYRKVASHVDHDFEHKQLLICLNDPADKNSKTVILNNKNKIFKSISPKQYQGICFDGAPHYNFLPKFGNRIMLVSTFI